MEKRNTSSSGSQANRVNIQVRKNKDKDLTEDKCKVSVVSWFLRIPPPLRSLPVWVVIWLAKLIVSDTHLEICKTFSRADRIADYNPIEEVIKSCLEISKLPKPK